jgi:hypothetical protein
MQQATNLRGLTQAGWILFPNAEGPPGLIPYDLGNQKYFDYVGLTGVRGTGTSGQVQIIAGQQTTTAILQGATTINSAVEWNDLVLLWGDVTIAAGGSLTLNNTEDKCQVKAMGDYTITVDGGNLIVNNAPASTQKVEMTAAEGVPHWGGLVINRFNDGYLHTLHHLAIQTAEDYGIYIHSTNHLQNLKIKLQNCLFQGNLNGIGVYGTDELELTVEYCDVIDNQGDGIVAFGLPSASTHYLQNCEISGNGNSGIKAIRCPAQVKIMQNWIHENNGANSDLYAGINCKNSNPEIRQNNVLQSNGFALITDGANSTPDLTQFTNTIKSATSVTSRSAIHAADGFPMLDVAHNNIINQIGTDNYMLIIDATSSPPPRSVKKNYWGSSTGPIPTQFVPQDNYDYSLFYTSELSLGTFNYGCDTYTDSAAYELLALALDAEYAGNFELAYSTLLDLVQVYSEAENAVCQALPHILSSGTNKGVANDSLWNYFNLYVPRGMQSLVGRTARQLRNDCWVAMEQYEEAVSDFASIANAPETLTDSIFALLNISQIYLIMSDSLGIPGPLGINESNPGTLNGYCQREDELLSLLHGGGASNTGSPVALPKEFALHQNFPNPFNPATTIRYDLPEISHVRISIYNMLGQKVVTLVDRTIEAGFQRATWDMSRSGNALASGLYIYQIVADGIETGKKFTTAKKMLMIK